MEGVGAVQELYKVTENLENRIKELEILNKQVITDAAKERAVRVLIPCPYPLLGRVALAVLPVSLSVARA